MVNDVVMPVRPHRLAVFFWAGRAERTGYPWEERQYSARKKQRSENAFMVSGSTCFNDAKTLKTARISTMVPVALLYALNGTISMSSINGPLIMDTMPMHRRANAHWSAATMTRVIIPGTVAGQICLSNPGTNDLPSEKKSILILKTHISWISSTNSNTDTTNPQ